MVLTSCSDCCIPVEDRVNADNKIVSAWNIFYDILRAIIYKQPPPLPFTESFLKTVFNIYNNAEWINSYFSINHTIIRRGHLVKMVDTIICKADKCPDLEYDYLN